jgi:hypothetical protein
LQQGELMNVIKTMSLSAAMAAILAGMAAAPLAHAAGTASSQAKPAAKAKPKAPAKAQAAAAATVATAVALSPGQLAAADRVFVGSAECEFGERIAISAVEGSPGHFRLQHRKATYNLVPEETTTGAVRLEDKRAGIVWLQIPAKSMMMNAKVGQRVADNCMMAEQKG